MCVDVVAGGGHVIVEVGTRDDLIVAATTTVADPHSDGTQPHGHRGTAGRRRRTLAASARRRTGDVATTTTTRLVP